MVDGVLVNGFAPLKLLCGPKKDLGLCRRFDCVGADIFRDC
jgi:hypothetical protein